MASSYSDQESRTGNPAFFSLSRVYESRYAYATTIRTDIVASTSVAVVEPRQFRSSSEIFAPGTNDDSRIRLARIMLTHRMANMCLQYVSAVQCDSLIEHPVGIQLILLLQHRYSTCILALASASARRASASASSVSLRFRSASRRISSRRVRSWR